MSCTPPRAQSRFLNIVYYLLETPLSYTGFTLTGSFDSDEGQYFISFIPRGQITNPCPHTFNTVLINLLFIEGN